MEPLNFDALNTVAGGIADSENYSKRLREALKKGNYSEILSAYFDAQKHSISSFQTIEQVLRDNRLTVRGQSLVDSLGKIIFRG